MSKAGYRGITLALYGLILSARCGAALPDDGEICGKLAQEITKVTETGKVAEAAKGFEGASVLRVLANDSGDFVHFDREELLEGAHAIRNALRERFHLSDEGADKIDDYGESERIGLTVMAAAPLAVVETEGGTAHCSRFQFFDVSRSAREVASPEEQEEGYCWGSSVGDFATLGEVGGRPTFAVESFADGNEKIEMFTRQNDRWSKSCHFAVSWKPKFAVAGAYCNGDICPKLQQAAMDIVSRFDETNDASSFWAKVPLQATPDDRKQHFANYLGGILGHRPLYSWPTNPAPILAGAQYRTMAFGDGTITVVTITARLKFGHRYQDDRRDYAIIDDRALDAISAVDISGIFDGRESKADAILNDMDAVPHDDSYPFTGFASDSVIVPIAADGKNYLARIGHGWFGWRMTDDYLVNVLESDGAGFFKRAAGFLISKTRGREVGIWPLEWPTAPAAPHP